MRKLPGCIFALLCLIPALSFSQSAFRIEADILTKTRLIDSTFQISKGKIFYDKNFKKIVFDFTFPQKEQVVLFDTLMYDFREDTVFSITPNLILPEQSFFHYMLSGNMANFGLEQSNFTAKNVQRKNNLVITTWVPPDNMREYISQILITTQQKRLYSVTMINADGGVMNRQILKQYTVVDGISIPTEVLIATYLNEGSIYQIFNLKNIKLNQGNNNAYYDFGL